MSKVAVIPLKAFLEARSDAELVTKLAMSIERAAVVKFLRSPYAAGSVDVRLIDAIEKGEHV